MANGPSIHHVAITSEFGRIEHVRSLTWPEVKEIWRNNEENLEHWKKYWESQGHNSWEEWRKKSFWRFNVARADWALYKFTDPSESIPRLKPGLFRGWKKLFYGNRIYLSFAELMENQDVINYPPLQEFRGFLQKLDQTTIIGLYDSYENITVIEGMHRCAAYTVSMHQGQPLPTQFYIALGLGKERWLSRMLYGLSFV
ncbi:MAG: hypothetical protein HYT62_01350 [Candidatus Yanofskybacteria bacterium]|nr:hypothetical protein [Candidatus Yanofskybacteria bacterium]